MHRPRTAVALALAIAAAAPAAAQAKWAPAASRAAKPTPDLRSQMHTASLAGTPAQTPAAVAAPAPSGFDWGDAGIGAAAGVGLSVLAVGGSLVRVGRRRHYATAR
jgi:hypothetical protein